MIKPFLLIESRRRVRRVSGNQSPQHSCLPRCWSRIWPTPWPIATPSKILAGHRIFWTADLPFTRHAQHNIFGNYIQKKIPNTVKNFY